METKAPKLCSFNVLLKVSNLHVCPSEQLKLSKRPQLICFSTVASRLFLMCYVLSMGFTVFCPSIRIGPGIYPLGALCGSDFQPLSTSQEQLTSGSGSFQSSFAGYDVQRASVWAMRLCILVYIFQYCITLHSAIFYSDSWQNHLDYAFFPRSLKAIFQLSGLLLLNGGVADRRFGPSVLLRLVSLHLSLCVFPYWSSQLFACVIGDCIYIYIFKYR